MSRDLGQVLELFISKKEQSKRISQINLKVDSQGIVGDKFYGKDSERSILLTSIESYKMSLEYGIQMSYGALGENILIDCNPYQLPIGTQLQLGDVVVEVTQNCTICNHLSVIDKRLPTLLKNDRGIFVKVIKEGCIERDNRVYLFS